jgi:nitrite reductase/ring-hydroxylating ferredoxin subunit
MGCWLAAIGIDFAPAPGRSGRSTAERLARRLVGLGVIAAIPTAVSGTSDWLDTTGAERRVGLVHALANGAATAGFAGSWLLRRAGHHRAGVALSAASGCLAGTAGWLGGHLVFALGVGVDTTAFQKFPTRWTDAGLAVDDVASGAGVAVVVEGVPVLVSRSGRSLHAIANRCTHRGAPLDEGVITDGCVTCPWHGSRFDLADGVVLRGPATRPQPALEARVSRGRVQVRRVDEVRALRLNPVGV